MSKAISLLLAILAAAPVVAQSPAASVQAAAADLLRVRADRQPYTRYLSLYHITDKKSLDQWDAVLRFWANSLSREADLVAPVRVAANLWRVDLGDYGWRAETWERLAEVEPYYTVKLITLVEAKPARTVREWWKGGINPADGKHYDAGWYNAQYPAVEAKRGVKSAFAPWVDAAASKKLFQATGSQAPIVRLDWWIFQTGQATDRKAGYYDWLALGTKEADFLALGKADLKGSEEIRKLRRANVKKSDVVHNARGMLGGSTLTEGVAFMTRDYARTVAEKNALRLLEDDAPEDGGEGYITLANGLFAFWVQNAKRERVDAVPSNIASNRKDQKISGTRSEVEVGFACVSCHIEGLRSINSWVKSVYKTPFQLEGLLDEDTRRLRAAYDAKLVKLVKRGNDVYGEALKECNGLTPGANAKAFAEAWNYYADGERTPAEVAAELGTDEKTLIAALKAEAQRLKLAGKGGKLDPILQSITQGESVRVEHLEEIFALAQEILGRHKP